MEAIWNEVRILRSEHTLGAQAVVEGEIPFPEGREGARLVDYTGALRIRDCRVQGDSLQIQGRVELELLGESREGELFSYSSRAAFTHSLKAPFSLEGMEGELEAQLQSLQIRGGGHVKAVLDLRAQAINDSPLRFFQGREGDEGLELEEKELEWARKRPLGPLHLQIRGEASVPGVQRVIRSWADASLREIQNHQDSVEISGVLRLKALCQSAEGRIFQAEQHVPFHVTVEGDFPPGALLGELSVESVFARSVGEDFGILSAEAKLLCLLFKKEEESLRLVTDAYSTREPFSAEYRSVQLRSYLGEAHCRLSLLESVEVPEGMPEASRMLSLRLRPFRTDSALSEGKLRAEGVIFARILYQGTDEKLHAFTAELPFSMEERLELPADEGLLRLGAEGGVSGAGRKAELSLSLYGDWDLYGHREIRGITKIRPSEKPLVKSGLRVVFAREGESLFSIAKTYNTTREKLLALDPGLSDPCREGQSVVMLL